ncbi:MAG: hypothetical protein HOA30_16980 [Rhodospirillaceae bacterium]|nr:hypothetical protein [Rhodospirillaceae bacterium]MBT6885733.1 hypothetical protein [Rhodospirillaceae bacterium]
MHDFVGCLAFFDNGDFLMANENLGKLRRPNFITDLNDGTDIAFLKASHLVELGRLFLIFGDDQTLQHLLRRGYFKTQIDGPNQSALIDHAEIVREVFLDEPQQGDFDVGIDPDLIVIGDLDQNAAFGGRETKNLA